VLISVINRASGGLHHVLGDRIAVHLADAHGASSGRRCRAKVHRVIVGMVSAAATPGRIDLRPRRSPE
jgi:hypothetical protein